MKLLENEKRAVVFSAVKDAEGSKGGGITVEINDLCIKNSNGGRRTGEH